MQSDPACNLGSYSFRPTEIPMSTSVKREALLYAKYVLYCTYPTIYHVTQTLPMRIRERREILRDVSGKSAFIADLQRPLAQLVRFVGDAGSGDRVEF